MTVLNSQPWPSGIVRVSTFLVDHQACSVFLPSLPDGFAPGAGLPWQDLAHDLLAGCELAHAAAQNGRGAIFTFTDRRFAEALVLRKYRHGGLWRFFSGDRFFSCRRFLTELKIHSRLKEMGFPVPDPLGVLVVKKRKGLSFVNGYFATKLLPGVITLSQYLQNSGGVERLRLALELGRQIRKLHDTGIFYTDLHIRNILVDAQGNLFLIDFDKAGEFPGPLSPRLRRFNLYRFIRSIDKFCSRGGRLGDVERSAFLQSYEPEPIAYAELFQTLSRGLFWRRFFYRPGWWFNRS
ncbi:MAG: hypothetical protein JXR89_03350 [Deltaproteobacteria bacterium]|nr:hypothetical protein [Deltaproteobacteria bacterium]